MPDKCSTCPIRKGCDIFSEMCRLTAREVATQRPDLLKTIPRRRDYHKVYQPKYYLANRDRILKRASEYQKKHKRNNKAAKSAYDKARYQLRSHAGRAEREGV